MSFTFGRDSTEVIVATQWAQVLGRRPASLDESFFEAGGTSFQAARLVGRLRTATGRDIPLEMIFSHQSTREQAQWIRDGDALASPAQHVYPLKNSGSRTPLVLLPNGSGTLVNLNGFTSEVFDRPVVGLLCPGFGEHERPPTDLLDLVEHFGRVLGSSDVPRRVHLLGSCGGGVFAYELGRALQSRGWQIASVTLFNTAVGAPMLSHDEIVERRLRELAVANGVPVADSTSVRPPSIYQALRATGMDMVEADLESFRRRVDVYASLWRIIASYRPTAVDIPVELIAGATRMDPEQADDDVYDGPDWKDVGSPRFHQTDLAPAVTDLNNDQAVLGLVETWLRQHDGDA